MPRSERPRRMSRRGIRNHAPNASASFSWSGQRSMLPRRSVLDVEVDLGGVVEGVVAELVAGGVALAGARVAGVQEDPRGRPARILGR